MRIVLTVPEDILREACHRITTFCAENIVTRDKLKELSKNEVSVTRGPLLSDNNLARIA